MRDRQRLSSFTIALLLTGISLAACQGPAPPGTTPGAVVVTSAPAPANPPTPAEATPTAAFQSRTTPTVVAATPTIVAALPASTQPAGPTPARTAPASSPPAALTTPAIRFVVPTAPAETVAPRPQPGATGATPDTARLQQELQTFFENFYQARSLEPGRSLELGWFRALVSGAYADYTIPLFQRDVRDAQAGTLRGLRYSNISVRLEEWQPGEGGGGTARATVTRTLTTERTDRTEAPQSATYQFRLQRLALGGPESVAWVATDFLNPVTGRWVSEPTPAGAQQLTAEIQRFFEEFYAARSVPQGGTLDPFKTALLTQFSYSAYTMPLLERQQKEVEAGAIVSIAYRDISVRLVGYDAAATNHGGMATVEVTRTALVTRKDGAEPPQTGTYQFRLHRHVEDNAGGRWLAVDFFQPEAKRWVSEIAGMEVPVPASGHG